MMTANDHRLIDKAYNMHFTESYLIEDLKKQADTDEARKQLKSIQSSLYHKEEYYAGCL